MGPYGFDPMALVFRVLEYLVLFGLFAGRARTVIDGSARTITVWVLVPRKFAFDDVSGLGLERRTGSLRYGMRKTYYCLSLFFGDWRSPRTIVELPTPQEVEAQLRLLHAETGVPVIAS